MREPSIMRAVVLEDVKRAEVRSMPIPTPGPREALIRVGAVGICGTDLELYNGHHSKAQFPVVPGHEWSGTIVQLGEGVTEFVAGDQVVGETSIACGHCSFCRKGRYNLCLNLAENGIFGKDGAMAEYMTYPVSMLHRVDHSVAPDVACLVEPAAVAYRAVLRLAVQPGEAVAVVGAGPIGLLTVCMLKAFGVRRVVAFDSRPLRLDLARQLGADETVNVGTTMAGGASAAGSIASAEREPFDAVVEASGNRGAIERVLELCAPGSRLCLLGGCGGQKAGMDIDTIIRYDMDLFGSLGSPSVWPAVVKLFESKTIDFGKLVSHRISMDGYKQALAIMEARDESIVKMVILPQREA
ncbi:zinc-dependent alcohol dehydrogenase [Paenibacillus koleovorans]|uniref:zinc-dependent alcohol dehydrogenase n=1 Tax=Paenibacillus koleovorans TaxID=121608 RepID=UPI000FDA4006|nr:alcohol dehydrogenase catalytic domain-containing protein [Paenibacillus koleovorans]